MSLRTLSLSVALFSLIVGFSAHAASVTIKPRIQTSVGGAEVTVTLVEPGGRSKVLADKIRAPFDLEKCTVREGGFIRLNAFAEDHASLQKEFDYAYCDTNEDRRSDVVTFKLEMERIREKFSVFFVGLPGARYSIDGRQENTSTDVTFRKEEGVWIPLSVKVEADGYDSLTKTLSRESVSQCPLENGRRQVSFQMDGRELSREVKIELETNIKGAKAESESLARTPEVQADGRLKLAFLQRRDGADKEWSPVKLRVSIEGYDWAPPGAQSAPDYERVFSGQQLDDLNKEKKPLSLSFFKPMEFVMAPVLTYPLNREMLQLVPTNFWAEKSEKEQATTATPAVKTQGLERLLLSSLSAPKNGDRIYFAMANYDYDESRNLTLKGSTIYFIANRSTGTGVPIQLTTKPEALDTDPAVSPNGNWLVFSSIESGNRCIKRVSPKNENSIPYTLTENASYIDRQPSVTDLGRLVFTRRSKTATPDSPGQIMHQAANERGEPMSGVGPLCSGHSPVWDPSGRWVAYIDPQHRLSVVSEKTKPRQLQNTDGVIYASPFWDSDGKTIYYAAAKSDNKKGQRHFDLFRLAFDDQQGEASGAPEQLTNNGSLDMYPCPISVDSGEAIKVFFLSNRGTQRYADEHSLGIFFLQLR